MTLEQTVALILAVGTLLPLVTSIIQQQTWSNRTRTIVGVGMSVLAGLVTYVASNGLVINNATGILTTVVGVVIAAIAAYNGIWKPSGVAKSIEVRTTNLFKRSTPKV